MTKFEKIMLLPIKAGKYFFVFTIMRRKTLKRVTDHFGGLQGSTL